MTDVDVRRSADELATVLKSLGTPERAVSERAYLKSALHHYGTSVPNMRTVVKRFLKNNPTLDHDELIGICAQLWSSRLADVHVHEHRMAVVELLDARPGLLTIDDVPVIERFIRESGTWALVDTLAGHVIADLAAEDPAMFTVLDHWVGDDDFWIRRSAVLGLSAVLRDGRELDRFFAYGDVLLPEREFFIRKVLGWIARETGRRHPTDVSAWLRRNLHRMNGVTIREAVKHLPDGDEVLALWKTGPDQFARRNKVG